MTRTGTSLPLMNWRGTTARRIASCVLVALAGAVAGCASDAGGGQPTTAQPVIAVTVDDVPEHGGMAPGETRLDISRRLVAALEAEGVPAYGFVNGSSAEMSPDSTAALEYWAGAFPVGNHTWSHPNINALSAEAYREEIARNEPSLERLSAGATGAGSVTRSRPRATIQTRGSRSAGSSPPATTGSRASR